MRILTDHISGNLSYIRLWQVERVSPSLGLLTADQWELVIVVVNRERAARERHVVLSMQLHPDPHPELGIPPMVRAALDGLREFEAFMAESRIPKRTIELEDLFTQMAVV